MQPTANSGADEKSTEQAPVTTTKGKGKKRSAQIAATASSSETSTLKVTHTTQTDPQAESVGSVSSSLPPHLANEAPSLPHRSPRSRPTSRDVSPYPRSPTTTPNGASTPTISSRTASASSLASSITAPPPRRSQRTLAKGPERPRGPPELEAALAIAIRNLESDIFTWWCANHKPGNPLPTTAYLKGRSPRIRRAAQAVDDADRLLNEAVYGKPKNKLRTTKKAQAPVPRERPATTPETALERLELSSQSSSPPGPATASPDMSVEADSGI